MPRTRSDMHVSKERNKINLKCKFERTDEHHLQNLSQTLSLHLHWVIMDQQALNENKSL